MRYHTTMFGEVFDSAIFYPHDVIITSFSQNPQGCPRGTRRFWTGGPLDVISAIKKAYVPDFGVDQNKVNVSLDYIYVAELVLNINTIKCNT